MATVTKSPARAGRPPWLVVAEREVRDLWLAGRGLALLLAYAIVLSVTTYFTASNAVLNFLSNRVSLSISVFTLLALFAPTQMPTSAQRGWFGDLLLRADPVHRRPALPRADDHQHSEFRAGRPLACRSGHRRGGRARARGGSRRSAAARLHGARMNRFLATLAAAVVVIGQPVAAAGTYPTAAEPGPVSVELDMTQTGIGLGQTIKFTSTVRNPGEQQVSGAIAHLNILGADPGVYVDPEDWSGERTQYLDPLDGGESDPLAWEMQGVNSGRFTVYVVITSAQAAGDVVTSKTLRLDVAPERTLDVSGLLPIAAGVPGAIVLLMGLVMVRRRHRRPMPVTSSAQ